jgi:hypothetical protein
MITDKLLTKYHIDKDFFTNNQLGLYQTFLIQTDYVSCKIAEAQFLGKTLDEDYTEILQAREYAREQIRLLEVI